MTAALVSALLFMAAAVADSLLWLHGAGRAVLSVTDGLSALLCASTVILFLRALYLRVGRDRRDN